MKKISKTLSLILCLVLLISFAGCDKGSKLKVTRGNSSNSDISEGAISSNGGESGGATSSNGGESGGATSSNGSESGGTTALPTRLSADGVDYLVNKGKLLISGNGIVTKDAIASLSPEYNEIDFEMGTFDIGDDAFNGYKDIIKVQFRNNVHNIGARAFQGTSLPLVCFGTSIESIGDKAFADCCIDYVLINNKDMFNNFNTRYDFGEVATTASNVYVHQNFISSSSDDFTIYNDIAGDYLAASGLFDELENSVQHKSTVAGRDYQFWLTSNIDDDTGFIPIYGANNLGRILEGSSYNATNNVFEYYSDELDYEQIWADRGVVMHNEQEYTTENVSTSVLVSSDSDKGSKVEKPNNTPGSSSGKSVNPPKKVCTCSACNGSGKKDCGSCDGGYQTDYETGTYMGYGSSTRAVRKRCTVCQGRGTTKCYCCPNH